jgi:hypothetical protein
VCEIEKKYEQKTFRVDVSGLFKPLTFRFKQFKGDFTVYFSLKKEVPNQEHGYELKADNKDEVEYPAKSSHILPGTNRFDPVVTLYITLEATQPCNILIESV